MKPDYAPFPEAPYPHRWGWGNWMYRWIDGEWVDTYEGPPRFPSYGQIPGEPGWVRGQ